MELSEQYIELYRSNEMQLKAYSYVEVLKEIVFKVALGDYSGKCTFTLSNEQVLEYKRKLQTMYDTLNGECCIEDCDFGNTLKLFFNERTLLIEGYFYNGVQSLRFSSNVDQTIIPPLITLLK